MKKRNFILIIALLWATNVVNAMNTKQYEENLQILKAVSRLDEQDVLKSFEEDTNFNTTFYLACYADMREAARVLIAKGVDVNQTNDDGNTPFHFAVDAGNIEICQMLLNAGADCNHQNNKGETPLHWAAMANRGVVCEFLCKQPTIDLSLVNKSGLTPLMLAATELRFDAVKILNSYYNASVVIEVNRRTVFQKFHCFICAKSSDQMLKCAECNSTFYCSRECQKKDWKDHKSACRKRIKETCLACRKSISKNMIRQCACETVVYCSAECQESDLENHNSYCLAKSK